MGELENVVVGSTRRAFTELTGLWKVLVYRLVFHIRPELERQTDLESSMTMAPIT